MHEIAFCSRWPLQSKLVTENTQHEKLPVPLRVPFPRVPFPIDKLASSIGAGTETGIIVAMTQTYENTTRATAVMQPITFFALATVQKTGLVSG